MLKQFAQMCYFKCYIHIRPGTVWCILKPVTSNVTFTRKKKLKEEHKFPHLYTRWLGQHLWKDKEKHHNFQLLGADLCKISIFFQLIWLFRERKKIQRSQISTFSTLCTVYSKSAQTWKLPMIHKTWCFTLCRLSIRITNACSKNVAKSQNLTHCGIKKRLKCISKMYVLSPLFNLKMYHMWYFATPMKM